MYFSRRKAGETVDSLSDDATSDDLFSRWVNGVFFACVPAIFGAMAITAQHAYCIGRRRMIVEYHGNDAIALGIAYIAVGLFMHGHYFWSVSRFYFMSEILKPSALVIFTGGIVYVAVNQFVFR